MYNYKINSSIYNHSLLSTCNFGKVACIERFHLSELNLEPMVIVCWIVFLLPGNIEIASQCLHLSPLPTT